MPTGIHCPKRWESLLAAASGERVWVGRLSGRAFDVSRFRRRLERTVNVAWTAIQDRAPALAERATTVGGPAEPLTSGDLEPWATPVDVSDWPHGTGVGMLAVLRRPS